MPLQAGARLGPYEVVSLLGSGGMGEVYRARDTTLKRQVALKVLPQAVSGDPERLARFQREAEVLAALNHPNIAHLYGLEKSEGTFALVMELVEGPTLADRIARGPIPLDEALPIARQVAEALEAAHEQGIVHRDLKPANIKVREDGAVKVLDFGLAKLADPTAGATSSPHVLSMSPTITTPAMTQAGMILGTAAYMSPEQARGKDVDRRADIWAFGCVLYEMLAGQRAFDGETVTDVLAAVVTKEPDWRAVTGPVTRLLKKCLQKDRRQRLRDIGDAWDLLETENSTHRRPSRDVESTTRGRVRLALAVVGLVAAAGVAVAVIRGREFAPEPIGPVRFQIQAALEAGANTPVVSPDGRHLVYQTSQGVIVRDLDSVDERLVATTDTPVANPFWSADSRSIGYATSTKLMRVSVSGGPPQTICDVSGLVRVGVWLAGNRILFTLGQRVLEVSAAGGVASVVGGAPPGFLLGGAPQVLPDGRRFVYVVRLGAPEERGVFVGRLDGATKPVRLLSDETHVAFVRTPGAPGGDLLFVRGGSLVAQPFDSNSAELSGAPSVIATNVQNFTASANGTVAYTGAAGPRHLTWFDRQGRATETAWVPAGYNELSLSPDGSRVAVVRATQNGPTTWIYDFSREAGIQLLRTGVGVKPVWASDGRALYVVGRSSNSEAYALLQVTPGRDANEAVAQSTTLEYPSSSSNDGRWLMYTDVDPKTKDDLWVLPLNGGHAGKPEPFLVSDYSETDGAFSPDGRRVVYVSDESGEREVYVRSFPAGTAGKWKISSGGGYQPRWNANGRELLYVTSKGELMSVDVTTPGGAFSAGSPRRLFSMPIYGGGASINNRYWDVAPDGQRFLVTTTGENSGTSTVTIVLNWQAPLAR